MNKKEDFHYNNHFSHKVYKTSSSGKSQILYKSTNYSPQTIIFKSGWLCLCKPMLFQTITSVRGGTVVLRISRSLLELDLLLIKSFFNIPQCNCTLKEFLTFKLKVPSLDVEIKRLGLWVFNTKFASSDLIVKVWNI